MRFRLPLIIAGLASAAAALSACEDSAPERVAEADRQPLSAPAGPDGIQIAYAKDGDFIRLAGEIVRIEEGGFLLDYGTGSISVVSPSAMKGSALISEGEQVMVIGRFDERAGDDRVLATEVAAGTGS